MMRFADRAASRHGFTLMELLAVITIIVLLGTASIAGYSSAVRGMEASGAKETVASLIRTTQQRAETDRAWTAIYFYNQLVREGTMQHNQEVLGMAVAVKVNGRFSGVIRTGGTYLVDEFADLEHSYHSIKAGMDASARANLRNSSDTFRIWRLDQTARRVAYDYVNNYVVERRNEIDTTDESFACYNFRTNINMFAFELEKSGTNGGQWKAGDAYAMEIQAIQLPRNYVFGTKIPTSLQNPIADSPVPTIMFNQFGSLQGGSAQVAISELKNKGSANGQLTVVRTFKSDQLDLND